VSPPQYDLLDLPQYHLPELRGRQRTQRTQRKEHYYLKETDNIRQRGNRRQYAVGRTWRRP